MKKIMQTGLLIAFNSADHRHLQFLPQYSATGEASFPYFHFGCLIIGGLIIVSLKRKYDKLYLSEAIGSFALYTILVAIFTAPVVDGVENPDQLNPSLYIAPEVKSPRDPIAGVFYLWGRKNTLQHHLFHLLNSAFLLFQHQEILSKGDKKYG